MEEKMAHLHDCLHRIEKLFQADMENFQEDIAKLKHRTYALEKFRDRQLMILAALTILIVMNTGNAIATVATIIKTLKGVTP